MTHPAAAPGAGGGSNAGRRVLDLGCGAHKQPGAIGADRNPASQADLLCDLDHMPYPFRDDRFDEIHLHHVIEHLAFLFPARELFYELRIVKEGSREPRAES